MVYFALGLAVVALVLGLVNVFRPPPVVDQYYMDEASVDYVLSAVTVWPISRLDELKTFDAVPAVLVCFGKDAHRQWLSENVNKWFRIALTAVDKESSLV